MEPLSTGLFFCYLAGMNTAEWLTRGTVWFALLCYGAAVMLQGRPSLRALTAARIVWSLGCILFLAHVASAFQFYHHWSHTAAAEETHRQTKLETGLDFRAGIYFNYLFAAVWLADCAAWIRSGRLLQERHRAWRWFLHGYFLFMIFNSTVAFGHGIAKPFGALLCAAVAFFLMKSHGLKRAPE